MEVKTVMGESPVHEYRLLLGEERIVGSGKYRV
jgi:hypothetical protein